MHTPTKSLHSPEILLTEQDTIFPLLVSAIPEKSFSLSRTMSERTMFLSLPLLLTMKLKSTSEVGETIFKSEIAPRFVFIKPFSGRFRLDIECPFPKISPRKLPMLLYSLSVKSKSASREKTAAGAFFMSCKSSTEEIETVPRFSG